MSTKDKEIKFQKSKLFALEKAINECKNKTNILKNVISNDENAKLNGLKYELKDLEKRFDELNHFNEFKHDKQISESFFVLNSNYKKIKKQEENIDKLNQELNDFKTL
jgi:hypothetical protein